VGEGEGEGALARRDDQAEEARVAANGVFVLAGKSQPRVGQYAKEGHHDRSDRQAVE
jgi:hypothetical protein